MTQSLTLRPAVPADASDLAVLFDAANRGFPVWFWSKSAVPGQSVLEVGRARIRANVEADSHYKNWHVAAQDGETLGAVLCKMLEVAYDAADVSDASSVFRPFVELERQAQGAWYVYALGVFGEHRGRGIGTELMHKAEALARATGVARMCLLVESFNPRAFAFYRRLGFAEVDRRPFVPFEDSTDAGDWILLAKDLTPS